MRQNDLRSRILDQETDTLLGIFRVNRYVSRSCFVCCQHAHHHFDGTLSHNGDQTASGYPVATQGTGKAVDAFVQLAVSQLLLIQRDGGCIRDALRLLFEQLNERLPARKLRGGVVKTSEKVGFFRLRHKFQLAHGNFRVIRHLLQQMDEMPLEPLDAVFIEHFGVKVEPNFDLGSRHHGHVEVIVRLLLHLNVSDRQVTELLVAHLLHLLVHRIVLESDDMVDQVLLLHAAGLNFIQRIVIITPGLQRPLLELRHQVGEHGVRFARDADRHRIDEQPDHGLDARDFHRSSGHDAAEYGIVRSVIFLQHHAPSGLQQRIDRNQTLFRHLVHPLAQVLAQLGGDVISRKSVVRHRFLLPREYGLPFITCQECRPIAGCCRIVLFLQPFDISAIIRSLIYRWLLAGCQGRVRLKQLLRQLRQAPAVHQNMLETPQHMIALLFGAQDRNPNERVMFHVEAAKLVILGLFIQIRLFLVHLQMKQLFIFKADRLVAVYDLQRLARRSFHKIRPQHQMTFRKFRPAPLEKLDVEYSPHRKPRLLEVSGRLPVKRAVEPHALLHRRKRVNIFDFPEMARALGDLLQFRNGQVFKLHVARRQFGVFFACAVGNELSETLPKPLSEGFHRLLAILLPAVVEIER
ncbi:hypothetical protein D3C73_566620 [compost metagenome]